MEGLPNLLKTNPKTNSINLEFCEIEALDPLLPLLAQFTELQELLLFGNRLESLPRNLSQLRKLEKLDISNNLIESIDKIIPSLKSLPSLVDLHITLQHDDEEQLILDSLPNLQRLNGAEIETEKEEKEGQPAIQVEMSETIDFGSEDLNLKQEDLEKVAIMYDEIRNLWRDADPSYDKKLAEDFDSHVKDIMGELSQMLKQGESNNLIHGYMLKAKHGLYLICQEKITQLIIKQNKKAGALLKNVNQALSSLFGDSLSSLFSVHMKYQEKIKAMKSDMEKAMKETAEVLEAAEQIEKEAETHKMEKERLKRMLDEEKEEMRQELETLQNENKRYLDIIIKHSKTNAESALTGRTISPGNEDLRSSRGNTSYRQVSLGGSRILTLRQLKDTILEIYASKAKFDQKCLDTKQPRETMEQHMYTFLNQKYGLKSLIIEWASAIISGIKRFSSEDNDVAVFGKILRNECDEEFRFVQSQVKETVAELVRVHLKGKYPLKTNGDIQEMLQEKFNGFLSEEEWTDIVKYMYNETDADLLVSLIGEVIQLKNYPTEQSQNKNKLTREELLSAKEKEKANNGKIAYTDLLKILLDFQLKGHEKFLSKFIQLFRKVDSDNNGVVNEMEFRELLAFTEMGFSEEDTLRLLHIVDPYNNQQITFSECISLFSTEPAPNQDNKEEKDKVAVLQKLSLSEE
ncbi:unnamed protein product [Blepharisma stoltei]|uniref:EF-hand domain-containing protein n=1 Tax=Blepharisma stoltei TaxID=1481888 RepID=A0AAU9J9N8_9CILI|nr:unnamed protein product [Blepharisma stoltei]